MPFSIAVSLVDSVFLRCRPHSSLPWGMVEQFDSHNRRSSLTAFAARALSSILPLLGRERSTDPCGARSPRFAEERFHRRSHALDQKRVGLEPP